MILPVCSCFIPRLPQSNNPHRLPPEFATLHPLPRPRRRAYRVHVERKYDLYEPRPDSLSSCSVLAPASLCRVFVDAPS